MIPKNSKKSLITKIILTCIIVPFILFIMDFPTVISIILSVILIAVFVIFFVHAYKKEIRDDKNADEKCQQILNGNYFTTAEWREEYLNRATEGIFEFPDKNGMKADLKKRYRKMISVPFLIFGLFMASGGGCIAFMGGSIFLVIFAVLIGILLIHTSWTRPFFALPFRKFRKNCPDFQAIENSYENGKILQFSKEKSEMQGINIGVEYSVIFNSNCVTAVENSEIENVVHHVRRVKKYEDGVYTGDKYDHVLVIIADKEYAVQLDEFQVESAKNELKIFSENHNKTVYSEKQDNDIVV